MIVHHVLKPTKMAQCLNCRTNMGCGCNVRKASDGRSCCTKCIAPYEQSKKNQVAVTQISSTNLTSPLVINNITSRTLKK